MQILEKVKRKIAFFENFSIFPAAKLCYLGKSPADFIITLRTMGKQAAGTVLDAAFRVGKFPAALLAQGIKRAVAEQTVKLFHAISAMTREILAAVVSEILEILPHNTSSYGKQCIISINSIPCLLYTSPSPRDMRSSRMPSSA